MVRIVLGFDFDDGRFIGRGRIALLELIGQHGSISQAAKAMNMSYKRAWYLMEGFGNCFNEPLIERHKGGKGGGSARLTPFGEEVIRRYRSMEKLAHKAFAEHVAALEPKLSSARSRRPAPAKKAET